VEGWKGQGAKGAGKAGEGWLLGRGRLIFGWCPWAGRRTMIRWHGRNFSSPSREGGRDFDGDQHELHQDD
jgi:hypothetical protein